MTFNPKYGDCVDLPDAITDFTRSIDTHDGCVILYYYSNCQGPFRAFLPHSPDHFDFTQLGFNAEARSFEYC